VSALLAAQNLSVAFGGVVAVADVSLDVRDGEVLGLVGPNGSGKSTFLNAVTGLVPARGELSIGGRRIRLGQPGAARRAGVLRTFQTPQTFVNLSCMEDVLLATTDRAATGVGAAWLGAPVARRRERRRWARARDALARFDLLHRAETPAAALAYGERRRLELARAWLGEPRLLLLDEPAAGLNAAETERLAADLRSLVAAGITLLVVEHKIDFLQALCDRVAVLELGRLIATGPATEIWHDQRVIDAYLGETDARGS
jgi:ABC-type branched-subunit amino acid transport system ATPase component